MARRARLAFPLALFAATGLMCLGAQATLASPYSDINAAAAANPVTLQHLRGDVSMLDGSGGEITVLSGRKGLLLVDAGIAVSRQKILAALGRLKSPKIRLVLNTHWHWDHTDGDGWVRATGADIMASPATIDHLGKAIRVEEWEHTFEPLPVSARPNIAIAKPRRVAFDGEQVLVRFYPSSHTDGDLSAYFPREDVLSTGDTFWNGQYPFIDYAAGGGVNGMIDAANLNLRYATNHTIIVPGHGPAGRRSDMIAYRDMLVTVRDRIAKLKKRGMSVDQVIAAKPSAEFDAVWGRSVITPALFARLVYRGV